MNIESDHRLRRKISTVFAIDGSGDKNRKTAERKRPIYRWDAESNRVSRVTMEPGHTALDTFRAALDACDEQSQILVAADLPIGVPSEPSDVYADLAQPTFLNWLDAIADRCQGDCWRNKLIAGGVEQRSPDQPFVSLGKGQKRGGWDGKRRCDVIANAESLYAVDHGPKQVGKAALQFWFDVMIPMRADFPQQTAIWPFQDVTDAKIVFAECYPALCQRMLFDGNVSKRNAVSVANALNDLADDSNYRTIADLSTWIHAASSEDEFDMFVTAVAISDWVRGNESIFKAPDTTNVRTLEGWILGLECD